MYYSEEDLDSECQFRLDYIFYDFLMRPCRVGFRVTKCSKGLQKFLTQHRDGKLCHATDARALLLAMQMKYRLLCH